MSSARRVRGLTGERAGRGCKGGVPSLTVTVSVEYEVWLVRIAVALELFDLGLNRVHLFLYRQHVADRRGSAEMVRYCGVSLQRSDAGPQVDVLGGDVGGLGGQLDGLPNVWACLSTVAKLLKRATGASRCPMPSRRWLRPNPPANGRRTRRTRRPGRQLRYRMGQLAAANGQAERAGLLNLGGLPDGALRQARRCRRRRRARACRWAPPGSGSRNHRPTRRARC